MIDNPIYYSLSAGYYGDSVVYTGDSDDYEFIVQTLPEFDWGFISNNDSVIKMLGPTTQI
jgi:hypothetical protein